MLLPGLQQHACQTIEDWYDWDFTYRIVVAQDGTPISTEERGHAEAVLPQLQSRLRSEVLAQGGAPDACSEAQDDSLLEAEAIPETGCACVHLCPLFQQNYLGNDCRPLPA